MTPELFLTESKCREESRAVKKVLEHDLGEEVIRNKLSCLTESHLMVTRRRVETFIKASPQKIFKFAHRILRDGRCQCLIEPFNLARYNSHLLLEVFPHSSPEQRVWALEIIEERLRALVEAMPPQERQLASRRIVEAYAPLADMRLEAYSSPSPAP